jgi:hypothetical protein
MVTHSISAILYSIQDEMKERKERCNQIRCERAALFIRRSYHKKKEMKKLFTAKLSVISAM